jgi:hypothetical protein
MIASFLAWPGAWAEDSLKTEHLDWESLQARPQSAQQIAHCFLLLKERPREGG